MSEPYTTRGRTRRSYENREGTHVEPRNPRQPSLAEDLRKPQRRLHIRHLLVLVRLLAGTLARLALDAVRLGAEVLRRLEVHVAELGRERLGYLLWLADARCKWKEISVTL